MYRCLAIALITASGVPYASAADLLLVIENHKFTPEQLRVPAIPEWE